MSASRADIGRPITDAWPSLRGQFALARRLFGAGGDRLVATWLAEQLAHVDDAAFADLFAEHLRKATIPARDYAHRVVDNDGLRLLGGIRFFNLDAARPFVDVIALNGAPQTTLPDRESDAVWQRLRRAVSSAWAAFHPRRLRLLVPIDTTLPDDAETDLTVHAAAYQTMADSGASTTDETAVSVVPLDDLDVAVGMTEQRYAEVQRYDPDLAAAITPASRDELADCQAERGLFAIRHRETCVGLLAIRSDNVEWLAGDVVVEEVIDSAYAGKGLAAAAQRSLARSISGRHAIGRAGALLLGTINRRNIASRKTAERAGRPAIMRYAFLDL